MEERMETLQTAMQPQSGVKKPLGTAESDLSQLGNHLIQKFHALMKVSLIYDSKNKVLQPFLHECLHLLNGLMEREGTVSFKVVKDDPGDVLILNTVGDLYLRQGRIADANKLFFEVAESYIRNNFLLTRHLRDYMLVFLSLYHPEDIVYL